MEATKEQFFKPTKLSAQEKAAQTHTAAQNIIAAEAAAREKKTERLRALRLAQPMKAPARRVAAKAPRGHK